jgi:soluble lytic murein transglycosylase-like protein
MVRLIGATLTGVLLLPIVALAALIGSSPSPVPSPTRLTRALRADFARAAGRFDIPVGLLTAVGQIESDFDPTAVGPPCPGGPALGMMQFLPSSWVLFNVTPGATPFDPVAAALAAANHLRVSGSLPGGWWDAARALHGYNHDWSYVQTVLRTAVDYGYVYAGPVRLGPG